MTLKLDDFEPAAIYTGKDGEYGYHIIQLFEDVKPNEDLFTAAQLQQLIDQCNSAHYENSELKNNITICEVVYGEKLDAAQADNARLREALHKLACLGNGDTFGNSIGNCIAQEALANNPKDDALKEYSARVIEKVAGMTLSSWALKDVAARVRAGTLVL